MKKALSVLFFGFFIFSGWAQTREYVLRYPPGKNGLAKVGIYVEYEDGDEEYYTRIGPGKLLVGYIDKTGKEVIPIQYDYVSDFSENKAIARLKDRTYILNNRGEQITEIKYESCDSFSDGMAVVESRDSSDRRVYGYIDSTGREVIPPVFLSAERFCNGNGLVSYNTGKAIAFGFVNQAGKRINSREYSYARSFSEGLAAVKEGELYGFIDISGRQVIPFKYSYVGDFSEGLAAVSLNERYGFIDKTGKEVIPLMYQSCNSFSENLATVKSGGKYGFINHEGKIVISPQFLFAYNFSMGVAIVIHPEQKMMLINKTGQPVSSARYDNILKFSEEGVAVVKNNNKYGVINKSGMEVAPVKYDQIGYFINGYASVQINGKQGCIDKAGKTIIPPVYDDITLFDGRNQIEELIKVTVGGPMYGYGRTEAGTLYGYVNKSGKEVVPVKFDQINDFAWGIAEVQKDGKYGFINQSGLLVLPIEYDGIEHFKNGLAAVKKDYKYGCVDKTGKVVIPVKFEDLAISEGMILYRLNSKVGCLDLKGNEIIPPVYDNIGTFTNGIAEVEVNNRYGIMDKTGKTIVPPKYDYLGGFTGGISTFHMNGKLGYVDEKGKEVLSEGITRDPDNLDWLAKAALDGNVELQSHLGAYYYLEEFGIRNLEKAIFWIKMAAANDDVEAQYRLANCYEKGDGVAINTLAAMEWFTKAAEQNHAWACNKLCYYNLGKNPIPVDYAKALEWIDKAISIEPENPEFYDSKGDVFLLMGKIDSAKAMIQKIYELDPEYLKQETNFINELKKGGHLLMASVKTNGMKDIKFSSAVCDYEVKANYGFPITGRGVCWNTKGDATIADNKTSDGEGDGKYSTSLTGLEANTTYYFRAYAVCNGKAEYGNQFYFTTPAETGQTLDKRDGTTYTWVKIGNQCWLNKNLWYLPSVTSYKKGSNNKPLYYTYDYDGDKVEEAKVNLIYTLRGTLYNWEAALTACPEGWHLPSDKEWSELEGFLAQPQSSGKKMDNENLDKLIKSKKDWGEEGITDDFGFSALPGGYRSETKECLDAESNLKTCWWTSDAVDSEKNRAWTRVLSQKFGGIYRADLLKENGFSVRCVKD